MINVQAVLCLAMVLTQAAGHKDHSVEELRELLKESVQTTISLTALAEQQTQKWKRFALSVFEMMYVLTSCILNPQI